MSRFLVETYSCGDSVGLTPTSLLSLESRHEATSGTENWEQRYKIRWSEIEGYNIKRNINSTLASHEGGPYYCYYTRERCRRGHCDWAHELSSYFSKLINVRIHLNDMNKHCLVIAFFLLFHSVTKAQVISYKNSVRLGIDYMSLDAPDDLGFRYGVRYARHLANDRIVLEGSLGYLSVENRRQVLNNFFFEGRPRQRITADLTVSFDLLRSLDHALRLGVGPSIWFRKDDIIREATAARNQSGNIVGVNVTNDRVDETNFGYHLMAEYEYAIASQITLAGRVGFASLNKAGISSIAGINVGYRF